MWSKLAVSVLVGSTAAFSVHPAVPQQGTVRAAGSRCPAPIAGPLVADISEIAPPVKIEGQTLKTWDIGDESIERVQLSLTSSGRPIHSEVQYWYTPAYIPIKFSIYTEDGALRPVDAVIETPKNPKTIAVYNRGSQEFPITANIAKTGMDSAYASLSSTTPDLVQGGKISAYTFGSDVNSVQILLKTKERNMKAKIELTQGPNQVKQIIELYASVGYKTPFYAVIQTPGTNNALRVINENTVEFPFDAWVQPYETGPGDDSIPIMGGF